MGQIIKRLKSNPGLSEEVIIELNDAVYGSEKLIHFHYKGLRYEMSLSDYLTILSGTLVSMTNLERLKNE